MIFDELITDRTQADVTNRRPKAFIAYNDLNRVEEACRILAERFVISITTKTNWAMSDFRTETDMERIRKNINSLRNAFFVRDSTPATPSKIKYQNIEEANNIETILQDMNILWESIDRGAQKFSFKLSTKQIGDRNA